ncbi:MAG: hypothetical protein IIB14_09675 [Chloroflexi bacterium]|nr:hypothetical protein [Chloroflexota bacterium]
MAIVGHFSTLAAAQTLTQSKLLAGLIQETIEDGHLAGVLPGMQITGLDVTYRRTGTPLSGAFYDIHEQIPWSAGNSPTSVTVALKRILRQDILDDFIALNYNSINDYKAIMVSEMRFGVMRTAEDKFIYGNKTTNAKEFDGFQKYLRSHDDFPALVKDFRKNFKFLGDMGSYLFMYIVGEEVPSHEEWTASRKK